MARSEHAHDTRTQTARGLSTRDSLLDAGTALLLERGYHGTGIQDVLREAGVPKGSFYHHFQSKEEFGLEVVNRYGEAALEMLDALLRDESQPPLKRIRSFFDGAFEEFAQQGCRHGCLLGNLGQELADVNDSFRSAVHEHLERWAARIATTLAEAQASGELAADVDPQTVARLLIDGFQGAALRMKLERSPRALERFNTLFFDTLLGTPTDG